MIRRIWHNKSRRDQILFDTPVIKDERNGIRKLDELVIPSGQRIIALGHDDMRTGIDRRPDPCLQRDLPCDI